MIPMSTMAQALEPDVHRITRAEYRTLHDAGYFEDRRVELLEGVIVEMQAMGKPHILAMAWLTRHVVRGLRDGLITNPALPVAASNISQPEPDLLVVDEGWPDLQAGDMPRGGLLAIELTWSSHHRDLVVKPSIYAGAGIPEYWVVDLRDRLVVVHTNPTTDGYAGTRTATPPDVLDACGVAVPLDELFAYALRDEA